jgi:hypothetical protein
VSRAAAALALVFGIWFLVFRFAFSLLDRTDAAEKETDEFRVVLSPPGVAQLGRNYATIRRLGTQFIGRLRPRARPGAGDVPRRL